MDPDGLRKCMSLGYSSKKTNSTIGQCMLSVDYSFFFSGSSSPLYEYSFWKNFPMRMC